MDGYFICWQGNFSINRGEELVFFSLATLGQIAVSHQQQYDGLNIALPFVVVDDEEFAHRRTIF